MSEEGKKQGSGRGEKTSSKEEWEENKTCQTPFSKKGFVWKSKIKRKKKSKKRKKRKEEREKTNQKISGLCICISFV